MVVPYLYMTTGTLETSKRFLKDLIEVLRSSDLYSEV